MRYDVRFSSQANNDIENAIEFYETAFAGLGVRFLKDLDRKLNQVFNAPQSFGFCDYEKVFRDASLDIFPFVIVFRIFDNTILIIRIFDTRMDPAQKIPS